MHKQEQKPSHQNCGLKDNPMTSRVVPIPCLEHGMKRLHWEEGLVILGDEGPLHLLLFVGLND
jgi:hypothetical protein